MNSCLQSIKYRPSKGVTNVKDNGDFTQAGMLCVPDKVF